MKIVIFTQHYYPENFRINYIIEELRKNNQLKVFTANPHYNLNNKVIKKYKKNYPYTTKAYNIEITRIPVFFQKKNHLSKILNYISYIFILSFYLLFSKKKSFDLVFVYATSPIFQCIPAILYKMKNKAPLIIWVQDLWPEVLYDLKIPFARVISFFITPIIKWIYESSDIILCQSNSFKKKISKLTSKKVLLYENPSDVINKKIDYNYDKFFFRILFAGNLGDAQDLDTLIKVGQLLKKNKKRIVIDIVGDGKKFLFLKYTINKFNLSKYLNLQGYISALKLSKYYSKSSALLILLCKGSGISNTIPAKFQTYLAYGRPLLVCSDGEINSLVQKNKLGLVCRSGNTNMLYKNIMLLERMNIKKFYKISHNCFNFYKNNYLLKKKTNDLLKIFNQCINNFKNKPC